MINRIFQLVATFVLLFLLAGIAAAPLSGSDKAFDPRPVLAWLGMSKERMQGAIAKTSGKVSTKPSQPSSKSTPTSSSSDNDIRLSICPPGSKDRAREVPETLARSLRGRTFLALQDVQSAIGTNPACVIQKPGGNLWWRYLVSGNKIIDAKQSGYKAKVEVSFTGF